MSAADGTLRRIVADPLGLKGVEVGVIDGCGGGSAGGRYRGEPQRGRSDRGAGELCESGVGEHLFDPLLCRLSG